MNGSKNFATRNNKQPHLRLHLKQRLREGLLILTMAFSLFALISLLTFHASDPGWSHAVSNQSVLNAGGKAGAWIADLLFYFCGIVAYLFPILIGVAVWLFHRNRHVQEENKSQKSMLAFCALGFTLIFITTCGFLNVHGLFISTKHGYQSGGILGSIVSQSVLSLFNSTGSSVILFTFLLIGVTLFSGLSWFRLIEATGSLVWDGIEHLKTKFQPHIPRFSLGNLGQRVRGWFKKSSTTKNDPITIHKIEPQLNHLSDRHDVERVDRVPVREKIKSEAPLSIVDKPMPVVIKETPRENIAPKHHAAPTFATVHSDVFPKLSLLKTIENAHRGFSDQELQMRSQEVEQRLADFGIHVNVVAVHPGPVVTRYELQLEAGTKVSKISTLAKDLARSLSVTSVRVVEVIPGKPVIGLELPNPQREIVGLQEILASSAYQNSRSPLSLALGKDIAGHPVVVDLAKMPHLLVAGTTGSGKSVSLNTMLLSLLYKSTPAQLRLILIDPKMLELSVYEGIPHLLVPVVTDMKDAASALRWCVIEMERRYRLMAALGVRNIAGYNAKIIEGQNKGAPILDPLHQPESGLEQKELQELPQIVVLADEFADMMVVVGKKVEVLIARLAQKARAAGIHLILATQRPSVDVITGLIKANIPTRIAFQVSSKIDSRTILDQQGAEQLLGNGDMLYLPPGTGVPVRVHGAFVQDEEVHQVTKYLKQFGTPDYIQDILDEEGAVADPNNAAISALSGGMDYEDGEKDPLYDEAVEFILKAQRVSVSSVQRRFRIGYNRASRLVEAMELAKIVSKMDQNGSREILVPLKTEES